MSLSKVSGIDRTVSFRIALRPCRIIHENKNRTNGILRKCGLALALGSLTGFSAQGHATGGEGDQFSPVFPGGPPETAAMPPRPADIPPERMGNGYIKYHNLEHDGITIVTDCNKPNLDHCTWYSIIKIEKLIINLDDFGGGLLLSDISNGDNPEEHRHQLALDASKFLSPLITKMAFTRVNQPKIADFRFVYESDLKSDKIFNDTNILSFSFIGNLYDRINWEHINQFNFPEIASLYYVQDYFQRIVMAEEEGIWKSR